MGIVKRESFFSSIVIILGIALGYVNTVFLFPKFLTADEFGLTRILISMAVIISQAGSMGLQQIIVKYLPFVREPQNKNHGFFTFVLYISLIGCVVALAIELIFKDSIIGFFVKDPNQLVQEYYKFLIPISFFIIFSDTVLGYIRAHLKTIGSTFIKEVAIRIFHGINILLFAANIIDFNGFMILFTATYALQVVIACLLAGSLKILVLPFKITLSKILNLKEVFQYGMYMLLNRIPNIVVTQIDVLMIGFLLGLKYAAIYTVGFYLANFIKIPARMIGQISTPIVAHAWKNSEFEKVLTIYRQTSINQLIIGSILLIGLLINFHNLLYFLPHGYREVFYVIVFIGFAKLFDITTGINGSILVLSKYYRLDLVLNILLVILSIGANLLLIPKYGINGAAVATAITVFFYNCLKTLFVWIKLDMHPFTNKTLLALLIAGITFLIGYFLPKLDNIYWDILYRSFIVCAVFGPSIYFFHVSEEINQTISGILKRWLPGIKK